MNILAMDTSQKTVSVALLADETILVDTFINRGINHSAVLLPAIEKACQMAGLTVDGVDLFALTIGPGSFTGLRIGASTVKGLALATGKPVVGISTLEALAQNGKSSPLPSAGGRTHPQRPGSTRPRAARSSIACAGNSASAPGRCRRSKPGRRPGLQVWS